MSSMTRSTVSLVLPLIVGLAAENAAVAQGRNAAAGTACAGLRVAVIRQYHDSVRRSHSGGCVQLADRRTSRSRRRLSRSCRRFAAYRARSSQLRTRTSASRCGSRRRAGTASSCRRETAAQPRARSSTRHWRTHCHAAMRSPIPTPAIRADIGDFAWAVGHPEKLIDYEYRAVHELTVDGKAITAAHYGGSAPKSRIGTAARRAAAKG